MNKFVSLKTKIDSLNFFCFVFPLFPILFLSSSFVKMRSSFSPHFHPFFGKDEVHIAIVLLVDQ